ncbi:hypothetical protein EG831_05050, partial [bacterium]|nr:hypothetical protein [bacterium]
ALAEAVDGGSGTDNTRSTASANAARRQLTTEQQRAVQQLQQVDRAVRAHEQAHLSAGRGVVTSGARFEYTYGPDGKQYAVGGEVGIDTSPSRKPQANIDKGRQIQAAALAPRDPSPQDYRVAAVGGQLVAQGQGDLVREQQAQRTLDAQKAEAQRDAMRNQREESVPASPLGIETAPATAPGPNPTAGRGANNGNPIRLDAPISITGANATANPPVVNLATAAMAPGNGINDITRQRLATTYTAGAAQAASSFSVFA